MQKASFLLWLPSALALIQLATRDYGILNVIPKHAPRIGSLKARAVQAMAGYRPGDHHGWLLSEATEEELAIEWRHYRRSMGLSMFRRLQLHRQPWQVQPDPQWVLDALDWSDPAWNEAVQFDRCPPHLWQPVGQPIFQRIPLWRAIQLINRDGFLPGQVYSWHSFFSSPIKFCVTCSNCICSPT